MNDVSSSKWIGTTIFRDTLFDTVAVTDYSGVSDLATYSVAPSLSGLILGDYTKWCSNLLFFPIQLQIGELNKELTLNAQNTGVKCQPLNILLNYGFNLGEYKYDRSKMFNDFRDFNPYTIIEVWLPFYGKVTLNPQQLAFKDITYIEFRLIVDYHTGKAVYIIGVNTDSVQPNATYPYSLLGVDDSNTRIIGQYTFQLGQQIPLGQSGMNEVLRNTALAGLKIVSSAIPTVDTVNSQKTITTPKGTSTITTKTERSSTRNISGVMMSAVNALANLNFNDHIDIVNSSQLLEGTPRSIHITFKRAKVLTNDGTIYPSLYGKPLGEVRQLNTLEGYTVIGDAHIDGEYFKMATSTEIDMINEILKGGVILPTKKR